MSLTDAVEIDLLKAFVGKATTIFAITVITPHVALYTTAPTESAVGTEVAGSSYARQSTPSATWPTPSAGSVANTTAVLFPAATGSGYTVVGAALCDALSAGNILRFQAFTGIVIGVGDQLNFPIGAITFTMD